MKGCCEFLEALPFLLQFKRGSWPRSECLEVVLQYDLLLSFVSSTTFIVGIHMLVQLLIVLGLCCHLCHKARWQRQQRLCRMSSGVNQFCVRQKQVCKCYIPKSGVHAWA